MESLYEYALKVRRKRESSTKPNKWTITAFRKNGGPILIDVQPIPEQEQRRKPVADGFEILGFQEFDGELQATMFRNQKEIGKVDGADFHIFLNQIAEAGFQLGKKVHKR